MEREEDNPIFGGRNTCHSGSSHKLLCSVTHSLIRSKAKRKKGVIDVQQWYLREILSVISHYMTLLENNMCMRCYSGLTRCPWTFGRSETESGVHSGIINPIYVLKLSRHG